jgi:hypothetical protein
MDNILKGEAGTVFMALYLLLGRPPNGCGEKPNPFLPFKECR